MPRRGSTIVPTWKFLGGLAGDARLTVGVVETCGQVEDLGRGEWAYLNLRSEFIGHTADGVWIIPRGTRTLGVHPGSQVAILHDLEGGWRLLVPRDFEPSVIAAVGNALMLTHVYRSIRYSRKVEMIFEAAPPERVEIDGVS